MNDTELTAIIVGLTGLLRTRFPRLDGLVVPIVALVLGGTLSAASTPGAWREALLHGLGLGLAAVGGMTAIGYAGSKIGGAVGEARATEASAAPSGPGQGT